MTTRIWLNSNGRGAYTCRIELHAGSSNPTVTVRSKGGIIPYDGVWIDGQRSYDTFVIINGTVTYHAPRQGLADTSFDWHEQAGGGHAP